MVTRKRLVREGPHGTFAQLGRKLGVSAIVGVVALTPVACAHKAFMPPSEFAAGTISRAAQIRAERMDAIAAKRNLPVPRDFRRLMDAAMQTNWSAVSNAYARVWPRSHQYENTRPDPRITTALWDPVHETYWIAYYFAEGWSPELAQNYAKALFDSLPAHSIVFAGTDASRFVAAPLAENGLRPDLFFISPNALANSLYMDYMEDLYGTQLWIPNPEERLAAFQRLIAEVQSGRHATPSISIEDSTFSIAGSEGLGEINAVLMEDILGKNQSRHSFFLDEGFPCPRLRPHLKPHGLLLELCPEPIVSLSPEEVAHDMAYWDKLEKALFATPGFAESQTPRLTYAVMRSAIARIYATRSMAGPAEQAFQQAIRLAPHACNAHYDYVMLCLLPRGETDQAVEILQQLSEQYPNHQAYRDALQSLR